jgi:hypothetical protein
MEDVSGSGVIAPPFLTLALDGGEGSVSRSCRFTTGERAPRTHCIVGCVGPRVGPDVVVKRKILPLPGIESRSVLSLSPYRLSYPVSAEKKCYLKIVKLRMALWLEFLTLKCSDSVCF